ncbi:MAG: hypothetical protein E7035_00720 [Verrucomicrobiaceae bacterium]|nr:hypothetical protein [Verrucomicrobiaceae bacterium]
MKGKIIGGILGFFIGHGLWGALTGSIVGHFIYDKLVQRKKEAKNICKHLSMALVKIAKVDGSVNQNEINECERIFDALHFYDDMRKYAIECFRNAKNSSESVEDITRAFAREFRVLAPRHIYMLCLCRVALADGNLVECEFKALQNVANVLRLNLSDYIDGYDYGNSSEENSSSNKSELEKAYEVLGVASSASDDEIKKVYRRKCKELHPDVLGSKNLGVLAMEILETELKRVNNAYETIKKYRR